MFSCATVAQTIWFRLYSRRSGAGQGCDPACLAVTPAGLSTFIRKNRRYKASAERWKKNQITGKKSAPAPVCDGEIEITYYSFWISQ